MLTRVRPFRHAASIILASNFARSTPTSSDQLSVLTVKRIPASSFMPSTLVFPGGAIDDADFNSDFALAYKQAFLSERKRLGHSSSDDDWLKHVSHIEKTGTPKPPAYDALRESALSSKMLPEWAFRVCALRELFEECGIFVGYCLNTGRYLTMDSTNNIAQSDNSTWDSGRRRVRDSANQFLEFSVRELAIVPAFWPLDEWSNWLAPSVYKQRSRFDTLFYVLCLDQTPAAVVNEEELEAGEWANPKQVLADGAKGQVILAPPQIYEMCRLASFATVEQLRAFLDQRRHQGLVRFFPQLATTADGRRLCILPGDDQYPIGMDESACDAPPLKFEETASELRSRCKNMHRAEFDFKDGNYLNAKVFISISPQYGHIAPVTL